MRLRSIGLIVTFALNILLAPLAADAQQPAKVRRVGLLLSDTISPLATRLEAFRQGLRELGWVEGQNIAIEYRWAEGRAEEVAAELVRSGVEVIIVPGSTDARAASNATRLTATPVVFVGVDDPIATGLVAGLSRPGGNMTGLSSMSPDLSGKRVELLKAVVPKVSRLAVLVNSASATLAPGMLVETEIAARALRLQLNVVEFRDSDQQATRLKEFDRAFSAIAKQRGGALIVLPDPIFYDYRSWIVVKSRLPAMYGFREYVEAGGLMSYGPSLPGLLRRAAYYVDKILKGTKPGDLPVEQPTRFELVINLKTAKALGLTIPPSVLIRADEVIQ